MLVAIRNMLNVSIFIVNVGCGDNASEVPEFVGGRHGNKTQALVFVYLHNQIQLAYTADCKLWKRTTEASVQPIFMLAT